MPTRQSFVVEMVGGDDVANAVALNSAVFNGARIIGPAIGGVLIAVLGTSLCFILNGLSYGAVVIGLLAMRDSELMPAPRLAIPRSVSAVRANLGEGLRYVWHTPVVLLAIGVIGFVSTFGMNFNVILPVMAASVLNVGPNGFGYLYAVHGGRGARGRGVGRDAGEAAPPGSHRRRDGPRSGRIRAGRARPRSRSPWRPSSSAASGAIATSVSANSLIQITVPGPLRGRVMSVYTTVFSGSTPIGNGLTGGVGGLWGTPAALVMNGAIALGAEAVAAVAVLRGAVAGVGPGRRGGQPEPLPARTGHVAGVPSVDQEPAAGASSNA